MLIVPTRSASDERGNFFFPENDLLRIWMSRPNATRCYWSWEKFQFDVKFSFLEMKHPMLCWKSSLLCSVSWIFFSDVSLETSLLGPAWPWLLLFRGLWYNNWLNDVCWLSCWGFSSISVVLFSCCTYVWVSVNVLCHSFIFFENSFVV